MPVHFPSRQTLFTEILKAGAGVLSYVVAGAAIQSPMGPAARAILGSFAYLTARPTSFLMQKMMIRQCRNNTCCLENETARKVIGFFQGYLVSYICMWHRNNYTNELSSIDFLKLYGTVLPFLAAGECFATWIGNQFCISQNQENQVERIDPDDQPGLYAVLPDGGPVVPLHSVNYDHEIEGEGEVNGEV